VTPEFQIIKGENRSPEVQVQWSTKPFLTPVPPIMVPPIFPFWPITGPPSIICGGIYCQRIIPPPQCVIPGRYWPPPKGNPPQIPSPSWEKPQVTSKPPPPRETQAQHLAQKIMPTTYYPIPPNSPPKLGFQKFPGGIVWSFYHQVVFKLFPSRGS